jgi:hypothetical protein
MRLHLDSDKETLRQDRHTLLRQQSVLRATQPVGYPGSGEQRTTN